ncbi:MAG: hypothetical protein AAFZ01_07550 [Pseudomonadota bacterium]
MDTPVYGKPPMPHLAPFLQREIRCLEIGKSSGWRLKRYAIIAPGREFDAGVADAAFQSAMGLLPDAGCLSDEHANHGIGFQIVHFADVAVVSPVFFWQWGSVLANTIQLRAAWDTPTQFATGVSGVIGCVWELEIVNFEVHAWRDSLLAANLQDDPVERYLNAQAAVPGST